MTRVVALVSSTGRATLSRAVASLEDCDEVVVVEDAERRGQAWTRNALLERAPPGSIVRFVDDDDVAMNTRRMAERLIESGADILAGSFISSNVREIVPCDPLAAAVDSVGPWSWVARADAIRAIPWDAARTRSTGTWQWLAMMDAGLRFAFAPDLWCYHWQASATGVTSSVPQSTDLLDELHRRIEASGRFELLLPLMARARRAGLPAAIPRLADLGARFKRTFGFYPNLRAPATYSEKMAARKAFDDNSLFALWCDKIETRRWAAERLMTDTAPRLLYVGDRAPAIMPPKFYAKPNHASGWGFAFDLEADGADTAAARARMDEWPSMTYGADRAEEAYLSARRCILLEELVPDVREVRAFVFDGRVAAVSCERGFRTPAHRLDYYDAKNAWLNVRQTHRNDPTTTWLDDRLFRAAVIMSEALGAGVDHVRVDWLESDGRLYFGEMTPFAFGGNVPFSAGFDEWLGSHWTRPAHPPAQAEAA